MPRAIYQKYRPQTFKEVVGHKYVKKILLNAVKREKVSHAYLFCGPRGTGKTSIARLISKAINCHEPKQGDACGKCQVCKAIQNLRFIDLIEIDAASNRGIDEIRMLKEKVNFAPAEAKKKVYIIDEVHMLTKEAFNALLKTLEEPPEFVVFVLATTEPHKIPPTILSRVQRFDLKLAVKDDIVTRIKDISKKEGVKITDEAAGMIYELGGGSFRDSESLLDKVLSIEVKKDNEITLKDIEEIIGIIDSKLVSGFTDMLIEGNAEELLIELDKIIAKGFAIDQLVGQVLIDIRKRIRGFYMDKEELDLRRLVAIAAELSEASVKLKSADISTLPLEIAIFNLAENIERTVPVQKTEPELKSKPEPKSKKRKASVKNLDFDEIQKKWPEVIEKSKKFNHHLFAFLTSAKVEKLDGDTLVLQVAYKFHKQKIEAVKSREILSKLFEEVFGQSLILKCEINADLVDKIQRQESESLSNEEIVEEIFGDE